MPHSGYIKNFVLEDTGYKFYTAEELTLGEFLYKYTITNFYARFN